MLAAEALIRERLARIDGVAGVHGLPAVSAEAVAGKKLPAIFVKPLGYRVLKTLGQASAVHVATDYLVVVATRSARGVRDGQEGRAQGGDVASAVVAHLLGWQPSEAYQPMQMLAQPPLRLFEEDGLVLLSLGFECPQIIARVE
ncbi:MAG: hypothetical protein U1E02_34555 [Hydrogenophaga sp.]|nr:hypothetical protein [Hydrogenophaga sp.]MDZ4129259.1 hypothetical protein [Hydrogenophaga sp.]